MRRLRIGIDHLAAISDAPGPDRIIMIEIILAANREKLGQRRLDVTGFIDGAALNDRRLTVPMPRKRKAGQRPRQHGFLQLRLLPALAIVDGYIDTADLAAAAPGDAADFVKSGCAQPLSARGARDDGFRLHEKT